MSRKVYDRCGAMLSRLAAEGWAKKAVHAYKTYNRLGKQEFLLAAEEHRHEALEHAALVGDNGKTVARIQKQIDKLRVW